MDVRVVEQQKFPLRHGTAGAPCATGYRSGAIRDYARGVGLAPNGAVIHPGGAVEVVGYADM